MTTSRVSVTEETRDRLREFCKGLGVEYDEAVNFLLDRIIAQRDPLIAGRELRDKYKKDHGES